MKLTFFPVRPELKPLIKSIWAVESQNGLPASDVSLAAPNGCPKLILNLRNSLISTALGRDQETREQSVSFVGIRDVPVSLRTTPRDTCFVGIEFTPHGAFPILGIPMAELANRLVPADALSTLWSRARVDVIWNLDSIAAKVDHIQEYLRQGLLSGGSTSRVVEYCVDLLYRTNGKVGISELARRTGYGRRTLEILFRNHVGVSPKVLAEIYRFQWFYKRFAQGRGYDEVKRDIYDFYYDQSHFGRDFRKMTGYPPKRFFLGVRNEFGRRLSPAI